MSETKVCTKCGQARPLSLFSPNRKSAGGRRGDCNLCRAAANPEAVRAAARRYRERHPDRQRAAEERWRAAHPEFGRQGRQARRKAVFDYYGWACACCGSTEQLQIDHMNGDGSLHRHDHGTGSAFYTWLVRNGFPEGFQTLCFPCNISKRQGARCRRDHTAVT